ncbi:MAG TPA: gluconokinase, partial [Candidatus Dormibacteraeota bacterium]
MPPERGADEVVLGVDIGTTATKVTAVDPGGTVHAVASAGYPLEEPNPGEAVQAPTAIVEAVTRSLAEVVAALRERGAPVAGVCLSSAMHSLLAVDAAGRPLTPSVTWADERAAEEAERLRATPRGRALHRRTGTPVHPMSPLVKLLWFREHAPDVFEAARCWMGIKEHVVEQVTGERVVDHSIASGMGMFGLETLDWDPQALALAGIDAARLPLPVPTTTVLAGLRPRFAAAIGLDPGTPVVVGAGDGPLANLGVGAVRPGLAACSIGTSGAVRVAVEQPHIDEAGRLFCYVLTGERWVSGGAINNGGVVLGWLAEALAPDLGEHAENALLALAAQAPAGSGGLLMLPHLYGERAPHWDAWARGAYLGLTHAHRREHMVRAALEGVCLQMAVVLDSVHAAGAEVRRVRATGGFARSPLWRQMLTDALGVEVEFPAGTEGSSRGAALLGLMALGRIGGLDAAGDGVEVAEVRRPDPAASAVYAELRPVFDSV